MTAKKLQGDIEKLENDIKMIEDRKTALYSGEMQMKHIAVSDSKDTKHHLSLDTMDMFVDSVADVHKSIDGHQFQGFKLHRASIDATDPRIDLTQSPQRFSNTLAS